MRNLKMNEAQYGYTVNCHYDWINLLTKMKNKNPERFDAFSYTNQTIYHYLDKLQQEQNLYD